MRISDWSSDVCSSDRLSSVATLPLLLGAALALGETIMPQNWTPLIALALSSQVVGQGLLIWALPRFSPLVIGLTLLVQPAVAALAGWQMLELGRASCRDRGCQSVSLSMGAHSVKKNTKKITDKTSRERTPH